MKRIATAVLLASLAVPAFAVEIGAPYEETNIERQLPEVRNPVIDQSAAAGASAAQVGSNFTEATGPWANDWNFIAPAQ